MTSWRNILLYSLILSLSTSLSGQDPDEIPGLRIWLDAQDADTVTEYRLSVSEWANKADGANPAMQVNSLEQPKYRENQINEQPALYFDGSTDHLVFESDIRTSAGGFHIFVVASGDAGGNNWARIAASWSGDGDPSATPNWLLLAPNESGVVQPFGPDLLMSSGFNQVIQNLTIGSDAANPSINHFKGAIGEILLYERQLSEQEVSAVSDYLTDKWYLDGLYEPLQDVDLQPTLRDLGDALGLTIGSITRDHFYNYPQTELFQQILGEQFGILTTGNATKYGSLSTGPGTYDFSTLERHLEVADRYNMKFHGHVFIWHNQLPGWLTSETWTQSEMVAIIHDHIDQVGGYLKGRVALWDVVNEPFNGDGTWRSSFWNDVIDADNSATDQRDYIDLSFKRARQVDPDAKLILNDYSVFGLNKKSDAMYAWAQSMINRGIPLDGVGFQMHMTGSTNYGRFAQNMQRFADLGLEIHITELDVRVPVPFTAQDAIDL